MPTLYLVRHGQAAAGFGSHSDPGLDDTGREQSTAAATQLARLDEMPIVSSPLARAQETAQPLCALWQCAASIEPRIAEIPSPTADLAARSAWLKEAMQGSWSALGPEYVQWRADLAQYLLGCTQDTVFFSHYVAINAAVGFAQNDDRLLVFHPNNASITRLTTDGETLRVLELGGEAKTHVN